MREARRLRGGRASEWRRCGVGVAGAKRQCRSPAASQHPVHHQCRRTTNTVADARVERTPSLRLPLYLVFCSLLCAMLLQHVFVFEVHTFIIALSSALSADNHE